MKSTKNFKECINIILIIFGILSAGLGLKGFLLPNHFIDGGITGISMLIAELSGWRLALLIPLINAPFVLVGYYKITPSFAIRSALTIIGLGIALTIIQYPIVTHDKLLASIFGGFFLGAGIGLSIRGGSVLDGTEILALVLSKEVGITVGEIIFALNIVIFSIGGLLLGGENAMYSMLTYFAAVKTIDFLIHGLDEHTGVIVVSTANENIKIAILNELKRGVTVYKGHGGYTEINQDILFCVVTRLEIPRIKNIIVREDKTAFIATYPINDVQGGITKKRSALEAV